MFKYILLSGQNAANRNESACLMTTLRL